MLKESFLEIEKNFEGTLEFDVPRAKYAYYRIGGVASVIATPRTFQALKLIHEVLSSTEAPFFILGWGSNLLFSDEAFFGVVIRMKHLFVEIEELAEWNGKAGKFLKLGSSLGTSSLLKVASERGYGNLSCLTGIPGSVGGMVSMNAGTHLGEFGGRVIQTDYVSLSEIGPLKLKTKIHEPTDFSYRKNNFLESTDLITHAYVEVESREKALVKQEIDALYERRKKTQPVNLPSCGSVFMNPVKPKLHAWQVVDQLGLRGFKVGNAQISEKHSNFIVNLGGASASDVRALIDLVKTRAKNELGIDLVEEVKFIP